MLKSLKVVNFQSHKDTEINFSGGLNVITGTSNHGKSSLFRAMLWLINNRPLGDAFRNWDAKSSEIVEVSFNWKDIFLKKTRDNQSHYLLEDKEYDAVGNDVPAVFTELLNLADYNIQTQKNPYFLLTETPGEVAKRLNKLIGLDIIDTIFTNLNSKMRETTAVSKLLTSEIANIESSLSEFADLSAIEKIITSLDAKNNRLSAVKDTITTLSFLVKELKSIEESKTSHAKIIKAEERSQELFFKAASVAYNEKIMRDFDSLIKTTVDIQEKIDAEKDWLGCDKIYKPLREKITKLSFFFKKTEEISNLCALCNSIWNSCFQEERTLMVLIDNYTSLLGENKICPTCKSPVTEKMLKKLTKEIRA
jgi:DNA repair ATPase RecN